MSGTHHLDSERCFRILIDLRLKGVSSGQVGWSGHVDHHRRGCSVRIERGGLLAGRCFGCHRRLVGFLQWSWDLLALSLLLLLLILVVLLCLILVVRVDFSRAALRSVEINASSVGGTLSIEIIDHVQLNMSCTP